ncbi:MAG: HAD family hydrolase [Bacteroidota bacterium]|nr:HAD family hydrolase [Bacteroidota bacterium]
MDRSRCAVFVDRDGTVNKDVDFLVSPNQLQIIPRSDSAIRELNNLGVKVFIVTNQSGIARGFLTEETVAEIHRELSSQLRSAGAYIDAYYYCPHLPGVDDPRYNVECECRKPKPGMLLQAAREHNVDLRQSFVIGDRCRDVDMGKNVGAGTVIVATGYGAQEKDDCIADFFAPDLYGAVQFVKKKIESR